jgi:hypothetical protein
MAVEGSNGHLIASDKVEGTAVGRAAEPLRWRREQPVQRRRSEMAR